MKIVDYFKLIISITISHTAGIIGSFFTTPSLPNWYENIIKSPLNPPSWVFGPIWLTLFTIIGISLFITWKNSSEKKVFKIAIFFFSIQLFLNILWSIIFFGWHNIGLAFIEICLLFISIVLTMFYFSKISKVASWLLLPYLLWVGFAGYLNYSIWLLN